MKIKNEIINEFEKYIKQPSLTFFKDIRKDFLIKLQEKLINEISLEQLKINIIIIEKIKFLDNSGKIKSILDLLDDSHTASLQASHHANDNELREAQKFIDDNQIEPFKLAHYSKSFLKARINSHTALINIHQILFYYYQNILAQPHKVEYNNLELEQHFSSLIQASKQSALSDNSNQKADANRKGITFNGQFIEGDIKACLVEFTGSNFTEGSPANKIYHFGGQYLHAEFSNEFIRSIKIDFPNIQIESLGCTKGKPIAWQQNNNTFYADIEFQILSLSDKETNLFVINNDGYSILKVSPHEQELFGELWEKLKDEYKGITNGAIVPLAEVRGRVDLVLDENGSGYFLKATRFDIKYNSQQITHESEYQKNNNALMDLSNFDNLLRSK